MIAHNVQEVIASYSTAIEESNHLPPQQEAPHTSVDCLQYFFPTALGVI